MARDIRRSGRVAVSIVLLLIAGIAIFGGSIYIRAAKSSPATSPPKSDAAATRTSAQTNAAQVSSAMTCQMSGIALHATIVLPNVIGQEPEDAQCILQRTGASSVHTVAYATLPASIPSPAEGRIAAVLATPAKVVGPGDVIAANSPLTLVVYLPNG